MNGAEEMKELIGTNLAESPTWMKWTMRVIFVLIIASTMLGGCSYICKKLNIAEDGPVEEAVESVIEHEIGIPIDLTPGSPER